MAQKVPPLDSHDFVLQDLDDQDVDSLLIDLTRSFFTNVYRAPAITPPPGIAEYLSQRAVYGVYQYHDDLNMPTSKSSSDVPSLRELPDAELLTSIHEDMSPSEIIQRGLVEAITSFFQLEPQIDFVSGTPKNLIASHSEEISRPTHASAYIVGFVRVVFDLLEEDVETKIECVAKLLTGMGVCPYRYHWWKRTYLDYIGRGDPDSHVRSVYWQVLFNLVMNAEIYQRKRVYSEPGVRWKLSLRAKLGLAVVQGSTWNPFQIASRAMDIDFAHHYIELGLALSHPILGNAIVAPYSASELIFQEMVGCVKSREDRLSQEYEREGVFQALRKEDEGITMTAFDKIPVPQENMVSLDSYFAKGELSSFVSYRPDMLVKVIVSIHGVMLYGVTNLGPWYMIKSGRATDGRDPLKRVLYVRPEEREPEAARRAIQNRAQSIREDWLSECPVAEESKRRFRNIINKPGRTLVRRSGIRGLIGRIIVFGFFACGLATIAVNWTGRENWLERLFDGTQVASLLAGLTVVLIFIWTRTLTNTLDLLGGVTEAQDLQQLLQVTGLKVEELQDILLYARGTLYWLSEHRAGYCWAVRLGDIVVTTPLDLDSNAEAASSLVLSEPDEEGRREAVWVMQGKCLALEGAGLGGDQSHGSGLWRVTSELRGERLSVAGWHSDAAIE